jgi:hypothetical protein
MAGHELVLGRDWFCVNDEYYRQQLSQASQNIDLQIRSAMARHRLTAVDMAILFARMSRGEITVEDFMRNNALITQRFESWMNDLKPLLNDPRYLVTSFKGARQQDPEGIMNPYMPDGLYQRDLWSELLTAGLDRYGNDARRSDRPDIKTTAPSQTPATSVRILSTIRGHRTLATQLSRGRGCSPGCDRSCSASLA